MQLYLSGGGSGEQSIEIDRRFAEAVHAAKPVLYIPIATEPPWLNYPEFEDWFRSTFLPLGIPSMVMWTEQELRGKTDSDFLQFGGVYIGGGNTFKLLKELREFGTLDILARLANANVPLGGGSAGAIVLGRTIIPALSADTNSVGLSDFAALNLVQETDIWCHYTPEMNAIIEGYRSRYNMQRVVALAEDAGLVVRGDDLLAIGPGTIKFYT